MSFLLESLLIQDPWVLKMPEAHLTHISGGKPPAPSHCRKAGDTHILSYYIGKW